MLTKLAQLWAETGYSVTTGPASDFDASVGILHIDRTVIEPGLLPANSENRPLLNGSVLDISKRRISANLVGPDSSWDGPVLIKTNANAFGLREIKRRPRWSFAKQRSGLARHLPWRLLRELPLRDYPILDSIREVPRWVWRRPDLVVERFLPERIGKYYALRLWIFLGDKEYGAILYCEEPIVKTRKLAHYEYIHEFPDSLREQRRKLGFDYGKFDYVMVDGEAVLLDANCTPSVREGPITPNLRHLATGIDMYLARP